MSIKKIKSQKLKAVGFATKDRPSLDKQIEDGRNKTSSSKEMTQVSREWTHSTVKMDNFLHSTVGNVEICMDDNLAATGSCRGTMGPVEHSSLANAGCELARRVSQLDIIIDILKKDKEEFQESLTNFTDCRDRLIILIDRIERVLARNAS